MPNPQIKHPAAEKHKDEDSKDLKGTFISVMLLGGFLIISWAGVWILYLIR